MISCSLQLPRRPQDVHDDDDDDEEGAFAQRVSSFREKSAFVVHSERAGEAFSALFD